MAFHGALVGLIVLYGLGLFVYICAVSLAASVVFFILAIDES